MKTYEFDWENNFEPRKTFNKINWQANSSSFSYSFNFYLLLVKVFTQEHALLCQQLYIYANQDNYKFQ